MNNTKIEWADATWNPIKGCSRVSEGCRNCYAEGIAARFSGPGQPYEGLATMTPSGPRWTNKIAVDENALMKPLSWRKPRRIFVNSMSDLFHESIPDKTINRVFTVMALAKQHAFLVLTKRPKRMQSYMQDFKIGWYTPGTNKPAPYLANVWLGVSVEDQATASERIPLLLDTPAAVRFISAEPLLGPVDIGRFLRRGLDRKAAGLEDHPFAAAFLQQALYEGTAWAPTRPRLDWVICGGESGRDARPMHPDWARGLRDQCRAAGVAFFFKQWGEWAPIDRRNPWPDPPKTAIRIDHPERVGKRAAGRMLDGREWNEMPEVGK